MRQIIIALIVLLCSSIVFSQGGIYADFTVLQADSLIKANELNPNFVILDVRTPSEYNPKHIEGAINRNYYDNFDGKLDSLDRKKKYLLHCQSGSRSAGAFTKMKANNFSEVYNMKGGISAWSNAGLLTTSLFAPKLMFVSDTIFVIDTINIGSADTIRITITNRANDTLRFNSLSDIMNPEFYTDFDLDTILLGAADYTFNIYFSPVDEIEHSLILDIMSNGGTKSATIFRTGVFPASTSEKTGIELTIYPNPASDQLNIDNASGNFSEYLISDINAIIHNRHKANEGSNTQKIDLKDLKPGIYFLIGKLPDGKFKMKKFVKG